VRHYNTADALALFYNRTLN